LAAYAVILDEEPRVACVVDKLRLFLPGGGLEAGEEPLDAVHREVAEECARSLEVITPLDSAIQFFHAASGEGYELHAHFFLDRFGVALAGPAQHELRWLPVLPQPPAFFHECHRWAVQQALSRNGPVPSPMSNKVLASLENSYGDYCVDIFTRPDGSFGFEEHRRDPEEGERLAPACVR
jgi:8-oxo-dGTP diphosphatase